MPIQAIKDADLLVGDNSDSAIAIVISHDCDLAQPPESEPAVEIIVGCKVSKADGNFAFAKNARRLQLNCSAGDVPAIVDLSAGAKTFVSRVFY